jgi:transcriptional regulator of arginine metabolism
MKLQRHNAIRELLTTISVSSQDVLRKKLASRGFTVTQATLSRDIRELKLVKGPDGYTLPANGDHADELPGIESILENFGLEVRRAQNLLVLITTTGSAQPVAASIDYEDWPEVMGTIAGDDTVLVICANQEQATALATRIEGYIQ